MGRHMPGRRGGRNRRDKIIAMIVRRGGEGEIVRSITSMIWPARSSRDFEECVGKDGVVGRINAEEDQKH